MKNIKDIILNKGLKRDHRNTYEYQAYGNRLAEEFSDTKHRSLYIKLAKNTDRDLLEKARDYVMRSENATTKGKLFMWKLTELRKSAETKEEGNENNKTNA